MKYNIDGVAIQSVLRGGRMDGTYYVKFGHDATLAQLEAINWEKPTIVLNEPKDAKKTYLPEGCGFSLLELSYSSYPREWTAEIRMGQQYYGDLSAMQEQVGALEAAAAEKDETIARQQATIDAQAEELETMEADSTAAAESQLRSAYQDGVESIG